MIPYPACFPLRGVTVGSRKDDKRFSYPKEKIRIVFLESIHPAARELFESAGYSVEMLPNALPEDQLVEAIQSVHILGIRSKSEINRRVLSSAKMLLAVGCFCIGTNQVDLLAAAEEGVAVFNAPFGNTRSVAELTIAEIIMLARRASHKSLLLHNKSWEKSAEGCVEVRNKTVGIVGYGHIGPQVGVLAEALGMRVVFYDILTKLPLGNAQQLSTLDELLSVSDFVTLHVPETPLTANMIGAAELAKMRKGACLLNLSRGTVVDIPALRAVLESKYLGGAAVDVFPVEPHSGKGEFDCGLCGLDNVILTPHIGGSTVEAQKNIGMEAGAALLKYLETGTSTNSVNFPQVELPLLKDSHRVMNIHRDVPGVLSKINTIVAGMNVNIRSQFLDTRNGIGYLIMDVQQAISQAVKTEIDRLPETIKTRLLF